MSTPPTGGRRAQQAADTRRLILDAALKLFAERGYGATSIGDVAAEAGVAVPTVYASVGRKTRLVELINDRIDEVADLGPLATALRASTDAIEVVTLAVTITRRFSERAGDLIAAIRSAGSAGPELAAVHADGVARHRAGATAAATKLASLGALQPEADAAIAAALLDVLLAPESWESLTTHHALSWDDAEVALRDAVLASVVDERSRVRHPSR